MAGVEEGLQLFKGEDAVDAALRFAGGRARLSAGATSEAYRIGINASIMGDMLTTAGADIDTDIARIRAAGYCV